MLSSIVMSVVLNAVMVPPGEAVVNHGSPGTYTQPVLRRYERYEEDNGRRLAWDRYTRRLDNLWKQFRADGSTKEAFETYKAEAAKAKRDYVYADPYLAPVLP
ncbi:MAG TPA: hypothetical protein VL096_04920 [Pirellulaceae bacterium]|nr:hypothetical protein [Pirellulaceae bacterium]